jgi:hypothetical protein
MKRRDFVTLLCGTAAATWPLGARAQQPGRIYRVGLLATGTAIGGGDERRKTILEGLSAHGFVEGRNLVFEVRWGDGQYDRVSEYAAALKALNVDVIVTFGYPAALGRRGPQRRCLSSSPGPAIRWQLVWSKVWRDRAAN